MATQKVVLDPEVALVTRAETLRFLRLTPNEVEPDLIESLINSASTFVNNYCQRHLKVRVYTGQNPRGNPLGCPTFLLQEYPVVVVTSIGILSLDGVSVEIIDPASYLTNPVLGEVRLLSALDVNLGGAFSRGTVWPDGWRIQVTYESGYGPNSVDTTAVVPADLKEATLIVIASIYTKVDQKDHRIASRAIEGLTEAFREDELPIEAKVRLDAGYKRSGFFGAIR